MRLEQTTPVPNEVLDRYIRELTGVEYKVLTVIIRQTLGWQKEMDWLTHSQLARRTGASRRAVSSALDTLIQKGYIGVHEKRPHGGRKQNWYSYRDPVQKLPGTTPHVQKMPTQQAKTAPKSVQKLPSTKETYTKCDTQKVRRQLIEMGILSS